ncbi:PorT family protein [Aquimarina sp. MAR_2010_214]|uniref:PorT family protein n=1 Tax=Aquimarina sp. MAR_2010_214 TaxID=1250026 RepID=UPI001E346C3D|nr:PorT family protein [Aquimarina sp. MAR_2010_214]
MIKNLDWKNNPTKFFYKLSENTEPKKGHINSIKEFGIINKSKYVRRKVDIDRSSENLKDLSTLRNPVFKEEQLFLKVLVEGKANLYRYGDGNLKRYFYKTDTSSIRQLIFKSYRTTNVQKGKNNRYKQQLLNILKCESISVKDLKNANYTKKELVNLFVKYNSCSDSAFINFEKKQKRDLFNLTIRPGIKNTSLSIQNVISYPDIIDFGSKLSFRFGVEAEFIMPFNKNKWALLIEPTYQYSKFEKIVDQQVINVDYKSIELPLGFRHYFFLNNNSRIFINGVFIIDLDMDSKINFEKDADLTIKTDGNLAFGIGYNYNQKYSLEMRYGSGRAILGDYTFWNSDYESLSVILGYTLF